MQFLAPLFWIAAAALAVPVYLHLVQRERTLRVPFSSLMFVRKVPIKEVRRRRLTHLFLLFLRCLGLVLLVLAFTRPVVTAAWFARMNPLEARSVVILIDRSLSMTPVWDQALAAAREKIGSLSESDEAMIIGFAENAAVLSLWESSRESLRAVLDDGLIPSFEQTSFLEGLRVASEQFDEARNGRKEIYLITDLQQAGMSAAAGWRVPEEILVEIEVLSSRVENVFVEEVRLERDLFADTYPHPVLVRIGGTISQPVSGEAQIFLEGQLIDRRDYTLETDRSVNVTFRPFQLEEGISRGRVVIEPADELAADNTYHFVIERRSALSVLTVREVEKSSFYFENALASGENLPFSVVPSASLPPTVPPHTALVVISDLRRLPSVAAYEEFVRSGGGLIVVLGNRVDVSSYRVWKDLLPVELVERRFVRGSGRPFTSITEVKWEHPVFSVFRDANRAAIVSTQFYGYWKVTPRQQATVVARFSEGDPALVEMSLGRGKVMVFASTLDTIWTDFPLRNAYLPFWYGAVQYASGFESAPAAWRINQVVPVQREDTAGTSGTWNLIDPSGRRVLGLDEEGPAFVPLTAPGHWEIRSNKETDWMAVNPAAAESRLEQIPEEEFLAVFVPGTSRIEDACVEAGDGQREERQSLWWFFLLAAAVVFMVESVVASRSRPRSGLQAAAGAAAEGGEA